MPKPKLYEFKIRIPPELMAIIDDARGDRSKNNQITDWLWSKARGDHADQLADALRPVLASLSEEDRGMFVARAISALEILSRAGKRK
ncbi:hypothetical protein NKJ72_12030 [Mesorhizobium sp. M0045]|uniref:hypothetical protein n=1 Tax=Mesorhizobium sp. M0045 TaxID=2956857 RepID=UPI00333B701C